jgi:hypothetical protein
MEVRPGTGRRQTKGLLPVKRQIALLTASLVAAAALSAISLAPGASSAEQRPVNQSRHKAPYSSEAITKLRLVESTIALAGECNLPATSLTSIITALVSSPLVTSTGLSMATPTSCANITTAAKPNPTASALTSMWAWGNPVSPADDERGLGESAFAPATISAYAAAHHLSNVRLSAPWASDQGTAIRGWLNESVTRRHGLDR